MIVQYWDSYGITIFCNRWLACFFMGEELQCGLETNKKAGRYPPAQLGVEGEALYVAGGD
ncbi:hypothetical protein VIOR3934_14422 [Vibrio orientalis CIP 102891 = ATCC 33934]|uniref:Uncharacterized protein n=1 Tax=Vibrio orientalis CIP 102891 = ATCC 33934 TaxID=675816 RepID=F9SVL1_VIBOR|nr:hypothetical protein VIOR3934_14422 [Vibrio orientalis CIP 102891 = ATCC 33934]